MAATCRTRITIHAAAVEARTAIRLDLEAADRYRALAELSPTRRDEYRQCAVESEASAERWRDGLHRRLTGGR